MSATSSATPTLRTVPVALGARSYEVLIGPNALTTLGARMEHLAPRERAFLVTDETVAGLHLRTLEIMLHDAGITLIANTVKPGETSKSWESLQSLCDTFLEAEMERGEPILALGGGVVGDLAGFAAAITKRGAPYIQIPTTLLSQVDSSVGGKTAINTRQGKNLIGAFHQPSLVIADTSLLQTLPVRDLRAGFAEIIKIAVLGDRAFCDWLEARGGALLDPNHPDLPEAIARAVALKAAIVADDEREAGRRALLNLGHTFGHGFERLAGYESGLRHGEAVAAGIAMAADYAVAHNLCDADEAHRIKAMLTAAGLAASADALPGGPFEADALFEAMAHDKKVAAGRITLILPTGLGDATIHALTDPSPLRAFLAERLPAATV